MLRLSPNGSGMSPNRGLDGIKTGLCHIYISKPQSSLNKVLQTINYPTPTHNITDNLQLITIFLLVYKTLNEIWNTLGDNLIILWMICLWKIIDSISNYLRRSVFIKFHLRVFCQSKHAVFHTGFQALLHDHRHITVKSQQKCR